MYEAGCRMVFCGFESGNNEILKLMEKKVTVNDYLNGLEYLHDNNIISLASYIIGYPGETHETAMDTLELVDHPLVASLGAACSITISTLPSARWPRNGN